MYKKSITRTVAFSKVLASRVMLGEVKGEIACKLGSINILVFDAKSLLGDDRFILATFKYGEHPVLRYKSDGYLMDNAGADPEKYKLYIILTEEVEYDLKPFDKVLVRQQEYHTWEPGIFKSYDTSVSNIRFRTLGDEVSWNYCIPYEGNEELLGTKNKPIKDE